MATKDVKADMETHPVNVETNKKKCSIKFKALYHFLSFLLLNWFLFISSIK